MNAFYSIADNQNFMTFVRLGTISIFLQNRVDERKTSERASVTVSVTNEKRTAMRRSREPPGARTSHVTSISIDLHESYEDLFLTNKVE